jgi:hypothetical protein
MAFSDYKTLESIKEVEPFLQKEIRLNLRAYRSNEYYASEGLVSPILRYVWRNYDETINFWTHQAIKYDDDLTGVPDFMFTHLDQEQYEILSYPIITSVEAKAENFTEGWSQCIVQLLACQKLNPKPATVFGIVTTGKFWEFGKLEGNMVSKHSEACGIDNLPKLITILDYLLSEAKKQL